MTTLITTIRTVVGDALDRPSPLVKQSATVIGVGLALILLVAVPELTVTHGPSFWSSLVVIALATALAALMGRDRSFAKYVMIIPAIDVIGLGLFRAGTGGPSSLFASLIILPVVWLASGDGRRFIAYAIAGTSLSLVMPQLLGIVPNVSAIDWLRGLFTPVVFGLAAAIINELSRQSRAQIQSIKRLADDKETMLQRTVEYAAQLQDSEAKFRAADRMFRGVWAAVTEQSVIGTDQEGLIDAWNPGATKLLGPTADDAEDRMHIFDFHLPEELEAYAKELNYPPGETVLNPGFSALVENARLGKAESREWTYVRSDGTHVPVQLSVTRRLTETGETRGYLFVASDVTQAREVARLKDEFVGLISHELRTPLSSVLGYLELMRDDRENPLSEEQLQYLGVAERNAHRLLRLVGDLLFTAQVESGTFLLTDARDIELGPLVTASAESARPAADAAGITLEVGIPDAPAIVTGDPVRLAQAVDNLVSNAIKFTQRGGTVSIALHASAREATITVRDTGMGIAAEELDQLFSRFFRASTATRNAVPGVGLGLTITKAIVTAHGGQMDVESDEGVGTCFTMSLPIATPADVE
ncbi:PAS domain-containing sensor histidine kinase [Salinibacterium soli]|uniref:histidine kinase n=1 Tax=Antiquaquibacter soli TaxID=3064523 RepID=A0ABT9BK21_9MICO|nr:ATP-binding protein [Protaetiibacter sp. WY-16]MDO7881374.1 ATP-binding protein [Protaetiibacter sp. WY-16]